MQDYVRLNAEPRVLQSNRQELASFRLVSKDELPTKGEGWTLFWQKNPDTHSYAVVSAVGFNQTRGRALVSVGMWCGGDCGQGQVMLLERSGTEWHIVDAVCSWMS